MPERPIDSVAIVHDGAAPAVPGAAPSRFAAWRQLSLYAAITGGFGVIVGFALHALLWEQQEHVGWFLGILLVVAVFAFGMEWLRERVDPELTTLHAHRPRAARVLSTLVILAAFELSLLALHNSFELPESVKHELAVSLLGPEVGTAVGLGWDVFAVVGLWFASGCGVGVILAAIAIYVRGSGAFGSLKGAAIGVLSGAMAAALLILAIVVAVVAGVLSVVLLKPEVWARTIEDLLANASWWGKLAYWPLHALTVDLPFGGVLVPILVMVVAARQRWYPLFAWLAAGFVLLIGGPLISVSGPMWKATAATAVIWLVPGIVIGALIPLIRRAVAKPELWGVVSLLSAVLLLVYSAIRLKVSDWVTVDGLLAAIAVALLLLGGWLFRKGAKLLEYWPFAAFSMATLACVLIAGLQYTTAGVMQQVHAIFASPLLPRAAQADNAAAASAKRLSELSGELSARIGDTSLERTLGMRISTRPRNDPDLAYPELGIAQVERQLADIERLSAQATVAYEQAKRTFTEFGDTDRLDKLPPAVALRELERVLSALEVAQKAVRDAEEKLGEASIRTRKWPDIDAPLASAIFNAPIAPSLSTSGENSKVSALLALRRRYLAALNSEREANAERSREQEKRRQELAGPFERAQLRAAQRLELMLAGSLAFWVTLGLLAGGLANRQEDV
jgi:hypothetical protein